MKIAVVSDTHDNWGNFEKILNWLNKENIQMILHCGDISRQDTIDSAKQLFKGEIKYARGNADFDLTNIPEKMEVELGGKKVAFCHFPDNAKKLAQSGKYDVVFYGHTHRPWEEKIACLPVGRQFCRMINPGELAGQFFKPTFAVYDTDTDRLELKILEKLSTQ